MKPIARVGDTHSCPIHGDNVIVSGGGAIINGRRIARIGDICACGAVIVEGSGYSTDGGRGVAHLGSMTSHGGTITSASRVALVKP